MAPSDKPLLEPVLDMDKDGKNKIEATSSYHTKVDAAVRRGLDRIAESVEWYNDNGSLYARW